MELENVSAEIRPRSSWEAVDLGCALVRRDFFKILLHWAVTVLPLQILIVALLWDYAHYAWLLIVFLKPLYDRIPLFYLSRTLFGERPSLGTLFRNLWSLMTRRFLWVLTFGRFSPSRSLNLPVTVLEGLRGKTYRDRVRLLARHSDGVAVQVLGLCGLLEMIFMIVFAMAFYSFLPETMAPDLGVFGEEMLLALDEGTNEVWLGLIFLHVPAMMLIEPFYVGSGFGLYVNSRTLTEGWDIELTFRRLRERVLNMTKGLSAVLAAAALFSLSPHARADVQADIQRIIQDEDFTVHTRTEEVPVTSKSSGSWDWNFGDWFSWIDGGLLTGLVHFIVYGGLAALIGFLVYWLVKNHQVLNLLKLSRGQDGPQSTTKTVVGLDVTPESLPEDLLAAAREALKQGDHQKALGLLYRGSISHFISEEFLSIKESDTEYDCVRTVREGGEQERAGYFAQLTDHWVSLAYGNVRPADEIYEQLFTLWPFSRKGGRA